MFKISIKKNFGYKKPSIFREISKIIKLFKKFS
jgi:acetyl-CoA carboxylase alpha subunit